MPPTVLHLATGNMFGGVESFLIALARHRMTFPELQPGFVTCFRGRLEDELRSTGCPVHPVVGPRLSRPWQVWRSRRELHEVLVRHRPAVAVSHATWTQMIFAPVLASLRIPLVTWVHAVDEDHPWREWLGRRVTPARVVLNSVFTSERTASWYPGVPRDVLYCPVEKPPVPDRSTRLRIRGQIGTAPHATVGVTACRLESWKGHETLLEALAGLADVPDWEWWIAGGAQKAGESEFLQRLQQLAARSGLADRVRFLGQRKDVPDLLAAADIHSQPNLGPEPFGIAYVEAMYAGLPVAATRIGGALEIVNDECGALVAPGDSGALAGVLREWMARPDLRRRLGERGRIRAESLCGPANLVPRIQSVLLESSRLG